MAWQQNIDACYETDTIMRARLRATAKWDISN